MCLIRYRTLLTWIFIICHLFAEVLDVDLKSTVRAQKRNEYDQQRKILQDQSEAIAQAESMFSYKFFYLFSLLLYIAVNIW